MLSVGGKIQFLLHIVFKTLCGNVFHTNHHDACLLVSFGYGPTRIVVQSAPRQLISAVTGLT